MSDSREVFSWMEGLLYLWNGATSGIAAYAESIEVSVEDNYQKRVFFTATGVSFGNKTHFLGPTNREVRMTIGKLYAGNSTLQLMQSAVNISAVESFNCSADGVTAKWIIWSARIPSYQANGREGGVWREQIRLIAPDVSGV